MKKWIAFIGLCLLAFTAFLDFTIVNTALPKIQSYFKAHLLDLQWVSNIFFLVTSASFIFVGHTADRMSKKTLLIIGIIIFALAALFAGLSESINWLITFRGLQSLGAACVFATGVTMIGEILGQEKFNQAAAIYTAITGIGLAVGPFVGGVLVQWLSWRWVFWVNIPIIVIGFCLLIPFCKRIVPSHTPPPLNYAALISLIVSLATFAYSLIDSQKGSGITILDIIIFAIAIMALIVFIFLEKRSAHRLIHPEIFTRPALLLTMLLCLSAGGIVSVFLFFDPLYLINIQSYSYFISGLLLTVIPIVQVLSSAGLSFILKCFKMTTLTCFSGLLATAAAVLHVFFGMSGSLTLIIIAFLCLGWVWGLANTACVITTNDEMPAEQTASTIGALFTTWTMSSVVYLTIASVVYKIFERMYLQHLFKNSHGKMSTQTLSLLNEAIQHPGSTRHLAMLHPKLAPIIDSLFMRGFHAVYVFMSLAFVVIFITSLITFILYRPRAAN